MLPEELSRELPYVYRNLQCLLTGWKRVFEERQANPDDPLLGGELKVTLAGYFNVPEDLEEHFYEPFWTREIDRWNSEDLDIIDSSRVQNLITKTERYVGSFLSSAKLLGNLCPNLASSLYLATELQASFQYSEVNPRIVEGLSEVAIDTGLHPEWHLTQSQMQTLEVMSQMLQRDQRWMLEEMNHLEQIEKELVQDDLSDDVEWDEVNVSYHFQPGARRNLVVRADHLTGETNQTDFNTIPKNVHGAWARQRHCWLFHDLYDHHGLSLSDVSRIAGWSFTLVRGYSFSTIIHP